MARESVFAGREVAVFPDAVFELVPEQVGQDIPIDRLALRRMPGTIFYEFGSPTHSGHFAVPSVVSFVQASELGAGLPGDAYIMVRQTFEKDGTALMPRYEYWPVLLRNRTTLVIYGYSPEVIRHLVSVSSCPFLRLGKDARGRYELAVSTTARADKWSKHFDATENLFGDAPPADDGKAEDYAEIARLITYDGPVKALLPGETVNTRKIIDDCHDLTDRHLAGRWGHLGSDWDTHPQYIRWALDRLIRVAHRFETRGRNLYEALLDSEIADFMPVRLTMRRSTLEKGLFGIDLKACTGGLQLDLSDPSAKTLDDLRSSVETYLVSHLPYLRQVCRDLRSISIVAKSPKGEAKLSLWPSGVTWAMRWGAKVSEPAPKPKPPVSPNPAPLPHKKKPPAALVSTPGRSPSPGAVAKAVARVVRNGGIISANMVKKWAQEGFSVQCLDHRDARQSCASATIIKKWSSPSTGQAATYRRIRKDMILIQSYDFFYHENFMCFEPSRSKFTFDRRVRADVRAAVMDRVRSKLARTNGHACIGMREKEGKFAAVQMGVSSNTLRESVDPVAFYKKIPNLRVRK